MPHAIDVPELAEARSGSVCSPGASQTQRRGGSGLEVSIGADHRGGRVRWPAAVRTLSSYLQTARRPEGAGQSGITVRPNES